MFTIGGLFEVLEDDVESSIPPLTTLGLIPGPILTQTGFFLLVSTPDTLSSVVSLRLRSILHSPYSPLVQFDCSGKSRGIVHRPFASFGGERLDDGVQRG